MRKRQIIIQWVVVIALFLLIAPAAAQSDFVPYQRFVALLQDRSVARVPGSDWAGDLYSWSPGESEWLRETYYGYNYPPVLSPDGRWVAYQSPPQEYVDAWQRGDELPCCGPAPTNVWLMDLSVPPSDPARSARIADQSGSQSDDGWVYRGEPVWSPDSTQLAWFEVGAEAAIMVYDTRTGTTTAAGSAGLGYGDGSDWGIPGLLGWGSAVAYVIQGPGVYPDTINESFGIEVFFVDALRETASIPVSFFASLEDEVRYRSMSWVLHNDIWHLALYYPVTGWVVLEPYSGTFQRLANPPFMRAATDVGWTGQVTAFVDFQPLPMNWQNDDLSFTADSSSGAMMTFTPEGHPIWLADGNQLLTLSPDGVIVPLDVPDFGGLTFVRGAWTPGVWMTDGQGTAAESIVVPCCQ